MLLAPVPGIDESVLDFQVIRLSQIEWNCLITRESTSELVCQFLAGFIPPPPTPQGGGVAISSHLIINLVNAGRSVQFTNVCQFLDVQGSVRNVFKSNYFYMLAILIVKTGCRRWQTGGRWRMNDRKANNPAQKKPRKRTTCRESPRETDGTKG